MSGFSSAPLSRLLFLPFLGFCAVFSVGCGSTEEAPVETPDPETANRAFPKIKTPEDVVVTPEGKRERIPEATEQVISRPLSYYDRDESPDDQAFPPPKPERLTIGDLPLAERALLANHPKEAAVRIGRRMETIANQITIHFEVVRNEETAMHARRKLEYILPAWQRIRLTVRNISSDDEEVAETLNTAYAKVERAAQVVLDSEYESILGEVVGKLKKL